MLSKLSGSASAAAFPATSLSGLMLLVIIGVSIACASIIGKPNPSNVEQNATKSAFAYSSVISVVTEIRFAGVFYFIFQQHFFNLTAQISDNSQMTWYFLDSFN